jgi:hypothetical protein
MYLNRRKTMERIEKPEGKPDHLSGDLLYFDMAKKAQAAAGGLVLELLHREKDGLPVTADTLAVAHEADDRLRLFVRQLGIEGVINVPQEVPDNALSLLAREEELRPGLLRVHALLAEARAIIEDVDEDSVLCDDLGQVVARLDLRLYGPTKRQSLSRLED